MVAEVAGGVIMTHNGTVALPPAPCATVSGPGSQQWAASMGDSVRMLRSLEYKFSVSLQDLKTGSRVSDG